MNEQTFLLLRGLIRHAEEIERALDAGAVAVTTSDKKLWRKFQNNIDDSRDPI